MTDIAAQPQIDDRTLLDRLVREKSNDAFEQIIRRYVDLVYATSLRCVRDRHLAEDVTQATFIVLWQRAQKISTPLPAWLHRTACYASSNALKMQMRRTQHEHRAAAERPTQTEEAWPQIEPLLDEALNRLSTTDRTAVLLRYYQSQSVEQTADALNVSVEAAKKRIQRALQKLRGILARQGFTLSLAALTATLATSASTTGAAPAGLTTTTAAAATAASASQSVLTISKGAITMLIQDQLRTFAIWLVTSLFLVGGLSAALPRLIGHALKQQVNTATSEPALSIRYSDVIELIVNDDGLRNNECIDFDKGVTVSGPQRGFATREEGNRWFRESGADCHAETQSGEAGLYPVQMTVVPVEREEWDSMGAEELSKNMSDARPQRPYVSAEEELPVTFAFKTREGGIGIAQITAMDRGKDEHGTITLRFKLVK